MTFRKGAAGKRRDTNEPEIVEALRGLGCRVYYVSGRGLPDLLVRVPGPSARWQPLEVKTASGKTTDAQQDIDWPIVRDKYQAIAAVFG